MTAKRVFIFIVTIIVFVGVAYSPAFASPAFSGGSISYGQTVSGNLSAGARDQWTFAGSSGDVILISLTSTNFDTYLELNNPSGSRVASDDDGGSGNNSLISYTLTSSGTFTIIARGYNSSGSGSYSLSLERTSNGSSSSGNSSSSTGSSSSGGSISYGQTVSGNLSAGARDQWTFAGNSGDVILISLTSTNFDTYLELNNPSGSRVASDDDGGSGNNSLISYTLTSSGTYTIIARGYNNSVSGSYSLNLERTLVGNSTGSGSSGSSGVPSSSGPPNIMTISNVACSSQNTYFILSIAPNSSIPSYNYYRINISGSNSNSRINAMYPVETPNFNLRRVESLALFLGEELLQVSGIGTVKDLFEIMEEESEYNSRHNVASFGLEFYNTATAPTVSFLIHGINNSSGGFQTTIYWARNPNETMSSTSSPIICP